MRRTIWDEMMRMNEDMEKLYDHFFTSGRLLEGPGSKELRECKRPIADYFETQNSIVAEIEMPGLEKKDIELSVDENGFEVKAEQNFEKEDKKVGRYERRHVGFYRYFNLPKGVDTNNVNAEYKDGVLKISVPKIQVEEKQRKNIDIN